jgi:hypothetical protein
MECFADDSERRRAASAPIPAIVSLDITVKRFMGQQSIANLVAEKSRTFADVANLTGSHDERSGRPRRRLKT